MTIGNKKQDALKERMHALGINEEDIVEKFIMGSGPGGQKINKTSSCVYLHHIPTGIQVKYHRERSRDINRYMARMTLCTKIEERKASRRLAEKNLKEKTLRQKRGRTRRGKELILEEKRKRANTKKMRQSPHDD